MADAGAFRQRLAAILAADAAEFSRLMSVDEHATVAALEAARAVFRSRVAAAQGRVIDTAGDSVLAVFDTAASAVSAALAIQTALQDGGEGLAGTPRLRFRIGVHLGDVIEKGDGSVYGDGVNIAARLQALAEPGGITVSESIRTAVRGKVAVHYVDQGEQRLKNIDEPIRMHRVHTGARAPQDAPARLAPETTQDLALPQKPSVAVLPFTNMSGDVEQEYFADGMTEDIITELSRFGAIFVIARNTTFTFKGQSVDVTSVARQLGVHFVLEGSVRRSGPRVRVTAQLIEGGSGRHVWAERYEDVIDDVFDVQERITARIVGAMVPEMEREEMRQIERGVRRFSPADDLAGRANKVIHDAVAAATPDHLDDAVRFADEAIALDRGCMVAWFVRSLAHWWRVFYGWSEDRAADLRQASEAADVLVRLGPSEGSAYYARGNVRWMMGEFDRALADQRRAHELNPSDVRLMFALCWIEAAAGNVERAKTMADEALRRSPKDLWIGVAHLARATAAFIERDWDGLRHWAELAIQSQPTAPIRRVLMIVYAAHAGDAELQRAHQDALQRVAPDFVPRLLRGEYRPLHRPEHMAMLLDALRAAGLPGTEGSVR